MGVNLDEVVAVNAGVKAGVLPGECENMVRLEPTPLSLKIYEEASKAGAPKSTKGGPCKATSPT